MALKRTPADVAFSLCVRERAGFRCERCGAQHERNSQGLHCSHFHGRGKWGVRFDPENAWAHCYGCHQHLGSNPSEFEAWVIRKMGQGAFDLLRERTNDTRLGRMYNRTKGKGEIAKHYRDEYQRLQDFRADGVTGRIEFEAFY